jgi:hypothetical protein
MGSILLADGGIDSVNPAPAEVVPEPWTPSPAAPPPAYGTNYDPGISSGQYYVDPTQTGKHQASNTRADLARAQWDDYKTRFQPVENILLGAATGDERMDDFMGRSTENVNQQYDMADQAYKRGINRYGISPTPRQQQAHDKSFGLSKASTEVSLRNQTRSHIADSNLEMLSGAGDAKGTMA